MEYIFARLRGSNPRKLPRYAFTVSINVKRYSHPLRKKICICVRNLCQYFVAFSIIWSPSNFLISILVDSLEWTHGRTWSLLMYVRSLNLRKPHCTFLHRDSFACQIRRVGTRKATTHAAQSCCDSIRVEQYVYIPLSINLSGMHPQDVLAAVGLPNIGKAPAPISALTEGG